MNDYPGAFDNGPSMEERPGWFKRNWLWFIPTIILLPMCCCCGGGGALFYYVLGEVFELPAYKDSVVMMEQNPTVQQALGTPIDSPEGFGDFVSILKGSGSLTMNQVNSQITFDADVPVSGPSGTGRLIIAAQSSDGGLTWVYSKQQVTIDATGAVIDLLPPGSAPPTPADETEEAVESAVEAIRDSRREIPDQE